ncbi:MAG: RNA polymerase sigma factor, partial [Acidimicrobiales bacterium]
MSDDELSARLAEGDDYALAAVFDRHVIALYDFVARLLGDADAGATAVRTTFVRAWNSPAADSGCRVPLFTAGYAAALESLKARPGRPTTSALALGLAEVEPALVPGGTDLVRHQELAGLVWVWASRLKRRDYAVADLHLRHGFDPGEIGRVVGLRPGAVTARLARLASEAQGAMAPAVLARRTPIECPALEVAVFALPGDTPLPAVSRVVRTHIGRCAICRNSQRGLASPLGLLSTMTPVALPQDRREEMWAAIALGATTRPPRARVKPPVHHLHHLHRPVVPRPVAAAGLALGVVAIALGVVLARSDDPSPGSDVGAPVGLASATHVVG